MTDPLAAIAQLPGVAEAVDTAREAVDRLYRHRVLRRASPAVSTESSLRGARASAAIEGVDVPLEALRRDEVHDPVVQGALRASAELGRLGSTWRQSPRQVLARLHTVAAAGLADEPDLGRPRAVPDEPDLGRPRAVPDPLGLGPAPAAEEAAARLESLFTLLSAPTKAPALVLAAVVHAELAVLRPFGTADGVVARAAERLTLVEYGLDPKSLVAVEVGHLDQPYAEGLRAYLTGTPEGVSQWIQQCASAVTLGVRETAAICEAMQRG
ncbi:oxidoreductase [Nonomuraea glycinis]|uniref:Oxidoreductase n=1 Tax=Nonomuraea glycinis TaxID=2047744 RepID=A0A918A9R1_9ACTN|nr:oxidoreductase [Nonomuraea glycinis]MCA2178406.1 oxidoreductase [Nonomuraea glycinis]WSG70870.1 oxidoreductase [Nonomuraea glycinis]GGP12320.1 oxidoreductase [Nonomuraea glycinis]